MLEPALRILEHLPHSFRDESESEYIQFLWDAFESNYNSEKFQFSLLACHMLYMSFVYFSIWKIRHAYPDKYFQASVFLAKQDLSELELTEISSPFTFSKVSEKTIFRMLRLAGCTQEDIKPLSKLVTERNLIAHSSGHIYYSDRKTADRKIEEVLSRIETIQAHMKKVIVGCYTGFLLTSCDPETREYEDRPDQIREFLIRSHYFSNEDIKACTEHDISALKPLAGYPEMSTLHAEMNRLYGNET